MTINPLIFIIPPLSPDFILSRNDFGAHSVIWDEKENNDKDHKEICSVDTPFNLMGQKDQAGLNMNKDQIEKNEA
jgi:hypothetical protein